jgi:polyphosphate kinase
MNKQERRQQLFDNREWSWVRFNERVLEEAEDPANPLLERVRFLSIFASNLDEFFMIRVAGLYRQIDIGLEMSGIDSRSPIVQAEGIAERLQRLGPRRDALMRQLVGELAAEGIHLIRVDELSEAGQAYAARYHEEVLYPVLTPMIVDPKHPFPKLQSGVFHLVIRLASRKKNSRALGLLAVPRVLPRFLRVGNDPHRVDVVPLESVMVWQLAPLFSGYTVKAVNALRVTRDADFALDEEAAEDFRGALAKKLLGRRHGAAVRLEHGSRIEKPVLKETLANLELDSSQAYSQGHLMQMGDLAQLADMIDRPDLKFRPMQPLPTDLQRPRNIFEWVRKKPQLFYHPYHSFDPLVELVSTAADDPSVLAIKQTFYRTSGDSPMVKALTRAAENGKQVTAVLELRARFDEERNLRWSSRLEQAGVHVVYGLVGYKTHCKVLLVVRREVDGVRRYIHYGTGNYNDKTARLYTDMGLLCTDRRLGADASALFNVITGATQPPDWYKVEASPKGIRRKILRMIAREAERGSKRNRGRIVAKMNSLVDREVIEALYAASQKGVRIELIVRGICCLRPGIAGLSDNIKVRSIVGRYLEHARIFWFRNAGRDEMYLSSADWMTRNLDHRVELMVPVEDTEHQAFIRDMLNLQLRDNVKARLLNGVSNTYSRVPKGKKVVDSQQEIHALCERRLGTGEPPARTRFVPLRKPRER